MKPQCPLCKESHQPEWSGPPFGNCERCQAATRAMKAGRAGLVGNSYQTPPHIEIRILRYAERAEKRLPLADVDARSGERGDE